MKMMGANTTYHKLVLEVSKELKYIVIFFEKNLE
jgi:hypothetical protein